MSQQQEPINFALKLYNRLSQLPLGKWLFTRVICFKAPYFSSISPLFESLENGSSVVKIKKRRKVTNHIGTVHAIALCNGAELAAGTMMEASTPRNMRWIPKGMSVKYLAKAETDIRFEARVANTNWQEAQDVIVPVSALDTAGKEVFTADVVMYVSPRSAKTGAKTSAEIREKTSA